MQKYIKGQGDDVSTVIVRPASTALLAISSNDRYKDWASRRTNPTNPFSILIQKNQALMNGYFRRIAMTEFRMNWTIPNFAQAWGNSSIIFNYRLSSVNTSTTITLADGFYGSEDLAKALQNLIQDQVGIPGFTVQINLLSEDDVMIFSAPSGYTFWFTPTTDVQRQLFDMLALPSIGSPGVSNMLTGIPDLRATEYVDLVCSQLTNNMLQKDSTSAPIVRDMIARIYLDDDVPSQAVVTTNTYNVTYASTSISASQLFGNDTVVFTVSSSTGFSLGSSVTVAGITGGTNYNGTNVGTIYSLTSTTINVQYTLQVSGVPTSYSGATITASSQGALTTTSVPQTTWDDRVNGVTPFVLYRQFPYPKQIRWEHTQPIANLRFELFDSQGRSMADLWSQYGPGSALTGLTGATYTSSTITTAGAPTGNNVTMAVGAGGGFSVGQTVSISGITGGSGYNAVGNIFSVAGNVIVVTYLTRPTAGTLGFTNARITANTVTFAVVSSSGLQSSQVVSISGLNGAGTSGFDGNAVVQSTPTSTSVIVNYPSTTLLVGVPPTTYTNAIISNTTDYESSFAWNCSILCSED